MTTHENITGCVAYTQSLKDQTSIFESMDDKSRVQLLLTFMKGNENDSSNLCCGSGINEDISDTVASGVTIRNFLQWRTRTAAVMVK